ncbi:MAG: epoxyqueuosine reductase [Deltaproteobacteria bacterium]|nr:epoxyqueuosine reductase [Deltaproteobacteria bacterium]MBW2077287.1 epoxyqueuosine reductase [Deltaproteobacteria bacterium]MBW2309707.1 epoxyqueuosine reductase [Deltaproteobacteria bacterium]
MENLTEEVKQFVLDQGMDLFGIASADCLHELTPKGYNRPKDILAECNSTIVIGFRWPDPLVDGLPELRAMYSRMMIVMNSQLDQTLLRIARFLTQRGFLAMPVHASDPYDLNELRGVLSHKHAAVQAGLGEFGLNNLLLTPQFGPRQRLAQVLTDAKLIPGKPLNLFLCEKTIPECNRACIRICPRNSIPNGYKKDPAKMKTVVWRGVNIDKQGCSYYQDRGLPHMGRNGYTFRCGLCITACPVGSEISTRTTMAQGIRPVRIIP